MNEKLVSPFLIVAVRYASPGGPMFVITNGDTSYLASVARKSEVIAEGNIPEEQRIKKDTGIVAARIGANQKICLRSFKAYFVARQGSRINEPGLVIGFRIEQIPGTSQNVFTYDVLYKDGSVISAGVEAEKRMSPEYKIPDDQRLSW